MSAKILRYRARTTEYRMNTKQRHYLALVNDLLVLLSRTASDEQLSHHLANRIPREMLQAVACMRTDRYGEADEEFLAENAVRLSILLDLLASQVTSPLSQELLDCRSSVIASLDLLASEAPEPFRRTLHPRREAYMEGLRLDVDDQQLH